MGSAVARRAISVFVIACTGACVGSYSRAIDETRAGLIGLAGRDLRACLGVPSDFSIDGDVEQQSFRFERSDDLDTHFGAGGIGNTVMGSGMPGDRGYDPHGFPDEEGDHSYCQLDFELTKGRVTRVSAEGRSREGMNADGSCLLRAEPCLASADEGVPESTE